MKHLKSKYIDTGKTLLKEHSLILDTEGNILEILPQAKAEQKYPHLKPENYPHHLILPGCVNTHSHAFQIYLRPTTGQPQNFRDWVNRFLYPLVLKMDTESLYASALLLFSEMLKHGITTVGEFFYLNNLPEGQSSNNQNAETVIAAARDVGIRITLIRSLYDQCHKPGQKRFQEAPEQALEQLHQLYLTYQNDPLVNVLASPHSLHGCSKELIIAAAEWAETHQQKWHIHLSEQSGDAQFALEKYGLRPIQALKDWNILNEKSVMVHNIWLDDQDLKLFLKSGAQMAYNPLTNMALGDGIARLPELVQGKACIGLGTDANTEASLFQEAKTAEYLQRSKHLAMGIVPEIDSLFQMLNHNGAKILNIPTGELRSGLSGDLLITDLHHPSILPALQQEDLQKALRNQLIFSMRPEAIQSVWVQGEQRVSQGRCTKLSDADIIAQSLKHAPSIA